MIDSLAVIPAPDPIPLPAQPGLLRALLIFTFILHLFPMNLTLGGSFLTAWTDWRGRKAGCARRRALVEYLAHVLPTATAYTITLGVAPLLFLQVLYGQMFYTSSVLMAWPWLTIIPLLVIGYYGLYLYALRREWLGRRSPLVGGVSALAFLVIGFLYTNNMALMLAPARWYGIYRSDPTGLHLNLGDPTVIPRFLHFFLAAVAFTGVFIAIHGLSLLKRGDTEQGRYTVRYGGLWFAAPTIAQFVVGPWYLFSLPPHVRDIFLGGDIVASAHLWGGVAFALAALMLIVIAFNAPDPRRLVLAGAGCLVLAIVSMAVARNAVREATLAPYFRVMDLPAAPQTGVILLFFALLAGAIVVIATMLKWMRVENTPPPSPPLQEGRGENQEAR